MNIDGVHYQSICFDTDTESVQIIDQTKLPHEFVTLKLTNLEQVCDAIVTMQVRGAPLIGVTAAYGMYLALKEDPRQQEAAFAQLLATRPTAINLQWALTQMNEVLQNLAPEEKEIAALRMARQMEREDIAICESIGEHGAAALSEIWRAKGDSDSPLNILTHCNAGALATVDWGTALSVVYKTAGSGIPVHVWVDETRPRNQGAALSCWELGQQGVPHTLIVDNAGGHLMQHGQVDVCVVGSDRTTRSGDVCNKIGTYLKALSAYDNDIPFYVALPVSSIDFSISDGIKEIPIEARSQQEVSHINGCDEEGNFRSVRIAPEKVAISNYGFDVTPARLVTGLITEHGIYNADQASIAELEKQL